ncbi:SIMPL domain-containing protein [Catenuloplanes sp. NPDC051500]|uniref:SIMPL domain-containing protein n=1 Tax=Catenuloplanes sp. NPDC051500 TaxID=3363959 RepID=UPI0037B41CC9
MRMSHIALPVRVVLMTSLVSLTGLVCGSPAVADPAGQPRESVLVTGTGEVFGEPDTLSASFAVETRAATVTEALDGASAAAIRMRDALIKAGLTRADLQTSNVAVGATENDDKKVVGYTASQGLTATIRDLPGAGALLSTAVAAGGDAARLTGVSFSIEDSAGLLAEARKRAFADARDKAELYARQAGRSLGRVVRVSEDNAVYHGASANYSLAADAAGAAVPIEPGRQQLTATVTVEWSFAAPRL